MSQNAKQQKVVTLFFRRSDLVRFRDDRGIMLGGQIECECQSRPEWYYVREVLGALHLVHWTDIEAVHE